MIRCVAFAAVTALGAGARPDRYQIALPAALELEEGRTGSLSLTIAPDPGYSISQSGPLRVSLAVAPEPGIELPRRRYRRGHAADRLAAAPRFDLTLRAARAGRYELEVDILFWLCRGRTCRPVQVGRTVAIAVSARPAGRSP